MAAATRWGILGAGKISNDFVASLDCLPAGNHKVVAVAARQLASAQEFAKTFSIEKAYGSYQDIANDPDVEVAYVGVLHPYHAALIRMLLAKGKHVLCEKPMNMCAAQTKEMVQLAKSNGVFLMEAVWSRCFPTYERIRREIASGALGDIIQVNVTFGVPISHVDRCAKKDLGGGATLDIGIYTLQLATMAFGGRKPQKVFATGELNEEGVDTCAAVSLGYEGGGIASINYTTKTKLTNDAFIAGTKGVIKIREPFWSPTVIELPNGELFEAPVPKIDRNFNFTNSQGLSYEAEEVRRCLKEGLKESPLIPLNQSIILAEVMDDVLQQLGVKYDYDGAS